MTITFYRQTSSVPRYYTIHDRQGHLFSPFSFTCVWGVSQKKGREKIYTFDDRRSMEKKLRGLIRKRLGSGYKVLYSFSRGKEYNEIFNSINTQAG